jgi:arginyl-tRNA synthetase
VSVGAETRATAPRATATGPVERAVADAVRSALGVDVEVERAAPGAPAEFRLDGRAVDGWDATSPDGARAVASGLANVPGIESAVAVPPRLYLRVATDVVVDAVVAAAAAQRRGYGWSDQAGGAPVTFSIGCPNANKPLHVGHLRNCFLGQAVSRLFETQGYDVLRTEELANYGVHVCQALVGWQRWGGGTDPGAAGRKADHFVGDFYARFHHERNALAAGADDVTELDTAATELLLAMHAGSAADLATNETFTEWAIGGIRETYERIGLHHDFVLRELEALPVALALVEEGLRNGTCVRRADGSVYIDLTDADLGEVTLLRRDGTPLALVCFVAIWVRRAELHPERGVVRITGEQWRESFTQFLEVLRRLGHAPTADVTDGIYYGMIRSPDGKIRSRLGNDVSADDLLDGFRDRFAADWSTVGAVAPYRAETCERLGLALLKLFILGKRREDAIVYENDGVWNDTVPRLARLLAALRVARDADAPPPPARSKAQRELALALNLLPRALARGAARYDSSDLVGYTDQVARLALDCARRGALDAALGGAVAVVLDNALWALDVRLPSSPRELPPCLAGARAAG